MKTDPHNHFDRPGNVKLNRSGRVRGRWMVLGGFTVIAVASVFVASPLAVRRVAGAATPDSADQTIVHEPSVSQQRAHEVLQRVIYQIAEGPAFIAKVRQTVWATGREVVGVGTYEQAGQGSGQFNLQLAMHDGDGKHQFQQISDGRLAWTRTEISGNVTLRRVDVGRLDEWIRKARVDRGVNPRLKIGGWTEMLDTIDRDHDLRLNAAKLEGTPVWVISGTLRPEVRRQTVAEAAGQPWPPLYPTQVRIVVSAQPGFTQWLPLRLDFWSDPVQQSGDAGSTGPESARGIQTNGQHAGDEGRLIALIELYSMQPIRTPPRERFRFDNQDAEVNFINETDRYLDHFGIELTAGERRTLQR